MSSLLDSLSLRLDDLSDPRIAAFMEEHLQDMRATSPPESVHALDMDRLRRPEIRFWTAWLPDATEPAPGRLVGTGALKHLSADHAELKSMRAAESLRGLGVGRAILEHILGQAVDGPLKGQQLTPIVHTNVFWFAIAAFMPDTIIYQGEG